MKTKKKTEEFYVTLGEKIIAAGVIGNKELGNIVSEVNVQYGYKAISHKSIYAYYNVLCNVYGPENFERTRILTGKRGESTCYSLKKIDTAKIKAFLGNKYEGNPYNGSVEKEHYTGVVTKEDEAYRNAVLEEAKEITKRPKMEAIRKARGRLRKFDKEMVGKIQKFLPIYKKDKIMSLSTEELFSLKKMMQTLCRYKVNLGIEMIDATSIKFTRTREEVVKEVSDLAWKLLGIKISIVSKKPTNEAVNFELTENESYIILVIGGLIMKNEGKKIESYQVVGALKNNHYRSLEVNQMQIERIIKKVPNLLEKVGTGGIGLVGNRESTWKNIQELYSPSKQEWIVPWCVNSDLPFKEIQNVFPNSWVEGEHIEVGSKIYMIKMDRSIKSFMKLALLSLKFRDTDFPIGESDLSARLKNEILYLNNSFINNQLITETYDWATKNTDKLLFQIEEGRV